MSTDSLNTPPPTFPDPTAEENIGIKIIGVGGAGNNAVDRLKLEDLQNVNLAVLNTDREVLNASPLQEKMMIGRSVTRGLGAGGEAEIGRQAALHDRESLSRWIEGVDLVFLLAGLGGGTGSGATPILAEVAQKAGALVIAFVTLPFTFEGKRRHQQAEESLADLRSLCHAVIPLPNDILLQQVDESATVLEAFALADEWIKRGVHSIWSMLFKVGLINVDFATLKKAFSHRGGKTLFGLGSGQGENFVPEAIQNLTLCPLLHTPEFSRRADNLIVNITGGPDLTLNKVNEIISVVSDKFGSKENTVVGAVIEEDLQQSIDICVLGTTDLDSREHYRTTKSLSPNTETTPERPLATTPGKRKKEKAMPSGKPRKGKTGAKEQEEFNFNNDENERGHFVKTARNFYEGEDLDVPTYLRRGVKIQL